MNFDQGVIFIIGVEIRLSSLIIKLLNQKFGSLTNSIQLSVKRYVIFKIQFSLNKIYCIGTNMYFDELPFINQKILLNKIPSRQDPDNNISSVSLACRKRRLNYDEAVIRAGPQKPRLCSVADSTCFKDLCPTRPEFEPRERSTTEPPSQSQSNIHVHVHVQHYLILI